jgi:hypothetical protein
MSRKKAPSVTIRFPRTIKCSLFLRIWHSGVVLKRGTNQRVRLVVGANPVFALLYVLSAGRVLSPKRAITRTAPTVPDARYPVIPRYLCSSQRSNGRFSRVVELFERGSFPASCLSVSSCTQPFVLTRQKCVRVYFGDIISYVELVSVAILFVLWYFSVPPMVTKGPAGGSAGRFGLTFPCKFDTLGELFSRTITV